MGFIVPLATSLASGLSQVGGAVAGAASAAAPVASLASVGLSSAAAAGAFRQKQPKIPERSAAEVEAERRRGVIARSRTGRSQTLLTQNLGSPDVARPTLLG